MDQTVPKISVIIPHYNMHKELPRAVESVVDQDYKNMELIIVDDGSRKAVNCQLFAIPEELAFSLIQCDHGGKPQAVNRGFERASGDYFAILDADDQLPQSSLSDRLGKLKKKQADLCIGSFETRYREEFQALRSVSAFRDISKRQLIRKFMTKIISPFHQNAMMFSRKLLERVGWMNPEMTRGQDKDFAIRMIQHAKNIAYLETSTYIYHRYERPLPTRIYYRCMGMKYLLKVWIRYTEGWRRSVYLGWISMVEVAKLIHDLFGVYKR